MILRFVLLSIGLFFKLSYGQFYPYKIGFDKGLPSNSVYAVCEDNDGRFWLGTDNGIAYLENGQIHQINHELLPKVVLRVYPAKVGGVYVVGNNPSNILKLDVDGTCTAIEQLNQESQFSGELICHVAEEGAIYYSDWVRIIRVTESKTDTLVNLRLLNPISISTGSNGSILITGNRGFGVFTEDSLYSYFGDKVLKVIETTPNGYMTIGRKEICIFSNGLVESIPYQIGEDVELPSHINLEEKFLSNIGSFYGLTWFYQNQIVDISGRLGMPYAQFTCLHQDRVGNIWCGTNGDGLVIIPNPKGCTNFTVDNGLTDNYISVVNHIDENRSIIKTRNGLCLYEGNQLEKLISEHSNLPLDVMRNVIEIKDEKIVNGLDGIYGDTRWFSNLGNDLYAFSPGVIKNGEIILFSWGRGFGRIHFKDKPVLERYESPEGAKGTTKSIVDVDSGYVIANLGGIIYADKYNGPAERMKILGKDQDHFRGLGKLSNGKLLAISSHFIYTLNNTAWECIAKIDDFNSKPFTGISIDAYDRIWISSENGLYVSENNNTAHLTVANGLVSNRINFIEYNKFDTTLWVATNNGLTILDLKNPNLVREFDYDLSVSELNLLDGEKKEIQSEAIDLSYLENSFDLVISLKSYFRFEPLEYRYRLREITDTWTVKQENKARFSALSPGDYTLEIQARTSGFFWSNSTFFRFKISPPFWQTGWFYLSSVLGLLFLFLIAYKLKLSQVKRRAEASKTLNEKMNQLQLESLNAQMNPHFVFNSLNSVQHFLIPFKNKKAIEYVASLARLIRANMNTLDKKRVTLEDEINRTKIYIELEQERYEQPLFYEIILGKDINPHNLWIPPMIFQPLVENAIWHGIMPHKGKGHLSLNIQKQDRFLIVVVTDNGIGLKKSAERRRKNHKSRGTSLLRDRLKLHCPENDLNISEITDGSNQMCGTQVILRIKAAEVNEINSGLTSVD